MMDDQLAALIGYLAQKTGLILSGTQRADLLRYLATRMATLGAASAADYIARLDDPSEFRALIDTLTVKETFFYRYEAQFDAFKDELLPGFLASARAEGRSVKLWSAGCCTGEEAYTLALLSAEAGCLDAVDILATDINEGYLEAAMEGSFSRRSVEKLSAALVAKYFSARQDRFILNEDVRRRVTLKYLNLAEAGFPSFLNGTSHLDMIFCRNVLIYFDKARVRDIIDRFAECLRPAGVLALGHSEMLPRDWPLTVGQVAAAFFYHKRPSVPRTSHIVAPPPVISTHKPHRVRTPRGVVPPSPSEEAKEDDGQLLLRAERLADKGHADDAARLCREVLARDASLERAHYLLGLLALDRPEQAFEHFRKALYLDPSHLLARLHLAQCAEKTGRVADAVREYRNLERMARAKAPEEILDPAEGITYGMLALMGRSGVERQGGVP